MPNGLPMDIQTFQNLKTTEAKLEALYDVLLIMHNAGYEDCIHREARLKLCEDRFQRIEKRKRFDTGISAMFGFMGGFMAMAARWLIGK